MGEILLEEFNEYRVSNSLLHEENEKILGRLDVIAQRQEMQLRNQELHSHYCSQLMAHYHATSSSQSSPLPPSHYSSFQHGHPHHHRRRHVRSPTLSEYKYR